MQAYIFDRYFARRICRACEPDAGGQLSQNRFKAWATGKPNLAWNLEQRNMEEDWRKPMVDGWAAVSALLTIQGYLDGCWVT